MSNKKLFIMEKKFSKNDLIKAVKNLEDVIACLDYEDAYDLIVEFFKVANFINDHKTEILSFPVQGWELFGHESNRRVFAKTWRRIFLRRIQRAAKGNDFIIIQRTNGEQISKDSIYVGNVNNLSFNSLSRYERASSDIEVQEAVRKCLISFIDQHKNWFDTWWLK